MHKSAEQVGPAARRLLHGIAPVAKATLSSVWGMQAVEPDLDVQFGCIRGRRREEAITAQMALGHRATNAGLATVLVLYNMSNAFPSLGRA